MIISIIDAAYNLLNLYELVGGKHSTSENKRRDYMAIDVIPSFFLHPKRSS